MKQAHEALQLEFRKSSYSGENGHCAEVAPAADGGRWLRNSSEPNKPALYYTADEWNAFIRGVKDGEFD